MYMSNSTSSRHQYISKYFLHFTKPLKIKIYDHIDYRVEVNSVKTLRTDAATGARHVFPCLTAPYRVCLDR